MSITSRLFNGATRKRFRWTVTGASLALLATLVPAGLASGIDPSPVDIPSGVLRLHSDAYSGPDTNPIPGEYFRWTDGSTTLGQQNFRRPKKNGCQVDQLTTPQDLVSFTAQDVDGPRPLGLITGDWGVSGATDGNGTGCSRVVTPNQLLTIDLKDTGPMAGLKFKSAEIDVEVKKGAKIEATLVRVGGTNSIFELRTGSSIEGGEPEPSPAQVAKSTDVQPNSKCLATSDSGPDSGANDNCRWEIYPDEPFDAIILRAAAGEFSLGAGVDGTPRGALGTNLGTGESLFSLVEVFDGEIKCLESVTAGDGTTSPAATFWRLLDVGVSGAEACKDLAYIFRSNGGTEQTVVLIPREIDPLATNQARFSGQMAFLPYSPANNPTGATLEYDPDGPGGTAGYTPMKWCLASTFGPLYVDGPTVVLNATIPSGETYCIASEETVNAAAFEGTVPALVGKLKTTWWVYGIEVDPGFRKG